MKIAILIAVSSAGVQPRVILSPHPMKVTHVAIRPTEASDRAGRPALTPELLAASGARYSRNNEGLSSILAKIDPDNLDKSVDSIFRMIDYGHQSIADMAPVALFIDGVSLWLAYHVWTLCPTAGGQESSTRYINYHAHETVDPETLGLPTEQWDEWRTLMSRCYETYGEALKLWDQISASDATVARIPQSLLEDDSERAQKAVARMRRNYSFDRARNFLPVCAPTNLMMVMSARGWVTLCQHLLSHPLLEAQRLGAAVRDEMQLSAPRLLKHAVAKESIEHGIRAEFQQVRAIAQPVVPAWQNGSAEHEPVPSLEVVLPPGMEAQSFTDDLAYHDNRYAWIGPHLRRTAVRFGWEAVALAEIRDLNRHRTGTKWCPLVPRGFYAALDQWPQQQDATTMRELAAIGATASQRALELLRAGDPSYIYWTLLGTQYSFEHTTTADKFIYEAELRTGTGAHFRYARHLHDVLELWYRQFPATRALILEGSAEPE